MKNLSKILSILLVASCSLGENYQFVSKDDYFDIRKCWEDGSGRFEAFLVLLKNEKYYTPYFISKRCGIVENGKDVSAESYGTFKVLDEAGLIRNYMNFSQVHMPSSSTDMAPHMEFGNIYKVVGSISKVKIEGYPGANIYKLDSLDKVIDTKVSFDKFSTMDGRLRAELGTSGVT